MREIFETILNELEKIRLDRDYYKMELMKALEIKEFKNTESDVKNIPQTNLPFTSDASSQTDISLNDSYFLNIERSNINNCKINVRKHSHKSKYPIDSIVKNKYLTNINAVTKPNILESFINEDTVLTENKLFNCDFSSINNKARSDYLTPYSLLLNQISLQHYFKEADSLCLPSLLVYLQASSLLIPNKLILEPSMFTKMTLGKNTLVRVQLDFFDKSPNYDKTNQNTSLLSNASIIRSKSVHLYVRILTQDISETFWGFESLAASYYLLVCLKKLQHLYVIQIYNEKREVKGMAALPDKIEYSPSEGLKVEIYYTIDSTLILLVNGMKAIFNSNIVVDIPYTDQELISGLVHLPCPNDTLITA